jgi:hypothetical protein
MTSLGVSVAGADNGAGVGAADGCDASADDGGGGGHTMVAVGEEYGADVDAGGATDGPGARWVVGAGVP